MERLNDTLYQLLNSKTGEMQTFNKVTTFVDGSPITDDKCDGTIFRKKGNEYFKLNYTGPINVKWFGAKGDGFTDDTDAFRRALNVSYYSDHVWVPNGNYRITDTLDIAFDNTSIICDKNAILNPVGTFTLFNCPKDYCEFKVNVKGTGTKPTGPTAAYVAAIVLAGTTRCNIHDCNITDFSGGGISLLQRNVTIGCKNNIVSNNYIYNCVGKDGSGSIQDMSHIRIGYSGSGYFHVGNKIINNTLIGNHNTEIGIGAICHGYDNLIEGNTISDFDAYGIACYEAFAGTGQTLIYRFAISGNHISNIGVLTGTTKKGMAIYLQKCHYSSVIGNLIENTMLGSDFSGSLSEAAIGMGQSMGTTVASNVIMNSNRHGIRAVACFNGNINANTIDTAGGFGVYLTDCSDFNVTDNNIYNVAATGINGIFRSTLDDDVKNNGLLDGFAGRPTGTGLVITGNSIEKSQQANPAIALAGTPAGLQAGIDRNYNPVDGLVLSNNTIRVSTTGINLSNTINSNISKNITRHFAGNATGIICAATCSNLIITQNDIKADESIPSIAQGIVYSGTNPIISQNIIGTTSGRRINYNDINIQAAKFVAYSTAAPSVGIWNVGDVIVNNNPTILGGGDADRQYFISGWTYVGTSWRENRVYPALRLTDKSVTTGINADTTLTLDQEYIEVDASASQVLITLPAVLPGKKYTIKKIDSSNNAVIVVASGGLMFDQFGTSRAISVQRGILQVQFNGTYWSILKFNTPGGPVLPRTFYVNNANALQVADLGYVEFSTGNVNRTYQLQSAVIHASQFHIVKKIDSGTGTVQILANGAETIDNAVSYTLEREGSYCILYSDGINWKIVSKSKFADLVSGLVPVTQLGSGTATATTRLAGDGTWQPIVTTYQRADLTTAQTDTDLNTLYPSALVGTRVIAKNIAGGGRIYEKDTNTTWIRIALVTS